jgi:hypothetical protein
MIDKLLIGIVQFGIPLIDALLTPVSIIVLRFSLFVNFTMIFYYYLLNAGRVNAPREVKHAVLAEIRENVSILGTQPH